MEGRTTVVIAHRLSTIKSRSNYFHQVTGKGTHGELMQSHEKYKTLSHLKNYQIMSSHVPRKCGACFLRKYFVKSLF